MNVGEVFILNALDGDDEFLFVFKIIAKAQNCSFK